MGSRDPNDLIQPFRDSVNELIKRANENGIPAFITDTTRTVVEQERLVAGGFSKTMDSKHLTGEAVDIAFNPHGPLSYDRGLYAKLYEISKGIDYIVWPFEDYGWQWDYPHFQYDKNKIVSHSIDMTNDQQQEYIKQINEGEQKERELNTEIGRVTEERDTARKEKDEEIKAKIDNYKKWQVEIERANRAESKLKKISEIL